MNNENQHDASASGEGFVPDGNFLFDDHVHGYSMFARTRFLGMTNSVGIKASIPAHRHS